MPRKVLVLVVSAALVFAVAATGLAGGAGTLDASFGGGDGKVTTDFDATTTLYDTAEDVVAAPGGKIVAVGTARTPGYDFAIARYRPNGDLDSSFGGDGKVTTDFLGGEDWAYAVEVLPSGKFLVVGFAETADGTDSHFALARYRENGGLDSTFGGDGKVTTNFLLRANAYDVAVLGDGSLVVVGEEHSPGTTDDMAIARYRSNGRLDREFGVRGRRTVDFGDGDDGAARVAVRDGMFLVGGWGQEEGASDNDVALVRLRAGGGLDRTFGRRGKKLLSNLNGNQFLEGLSVFRSGRFVISFYVDSEDFALAKFLPDGRLDDDFGPGGITIKDFGLQESTSDLVRSGRRLYVIGTAAENLAVAAFGANGRAIQAFGEGGLGTADFGGFDLGNAGAMVGGRVVVAGLADNQHFALARFLT